MREQILVFAGPTLSGLTELKKSLSDHFVFHGPIKCGQLFEAFREGFRKFVIIDGYFERIAAVWHKEILYVLNEGAEVWGCSSMGALRAYETEVFGMQGFGQIFEDYKSQKIKNDDEVCVAHLSAERDYAPITDALVNIRATLKRAVDQSTLSPFEANQILSLAEKTHFKKRLLIQLAEHTMQVEPNPVFLKSLAEEGLVNQKQMDAIALLKKLRQSVEITKTQARFNGSDEAFHHSLKLQTLQYLCNIHPPSIETAALAEDNRLLKMGHLLLGKQRALLTQLSSALMHFAKAAKRVNAQNHSQIPPWIGERSLESSPVSHALVSTALKLCPEYSTVQPVPYTVKLLALASEFPLQQMDLSLPQSKEHFELQSFARYSRLLFCIGLFTDARLKCDELAQNLQAEESAVAAHRDRYTRYGFKSESELERFISLFGLTDFKKSVLDLEKIQMLLNAKDITASFGFLDEKTYWYREASNVSGVYHEMQALKNPSILAKFEKDIHAAFSSWSAEKRREYFVLHDLEDLSEYADLQRFTQQCIAGPSGATL